jgi:hypothetical protein
VINLDKFFPGVLPGLPATQRGSSHWTFVFNIEFGQFGLADHRCRPLIDSPGNINRSVMKWSAGIKSVSLEAVNEIDKAAS